ncbi:MAG: hypothetical protein EZS28_031918 [Streblomastix strix]|uniref:U-box domain-containing protein n=1 Tax=Streblomastix strix TaxID=222440 RepID=A0A5J4UPB7_9EUKA|nr:MAG: hypothetical protein EZS28_031918 [Streblomastix strix]
MNREELYNEGFICPITQEIMTDPVIAEDGNSYERQAIVDWLKIKKISPITREPMNERLFPDLELKKKIDIERNKQEKEQRQETTFLLMTVACNEIKHILFNKQPYSSLLRMTEEPALHPHYRIMVELDGIDKIFRMFNRNDIGKNSKDYAAFCISTLFKMQKIPNAVMSEQIIDHLKSIINDPMINNKSLAKIGIVLLAMNYSNKVEIEKDGFIVPELDD